MVENQLRRPQGMHFRRPVALLLFTLLIASPLSGCLGTSEEFEDIEPEFLLLVDEMRRGEFHDFVISGETKLEVPSTVLLFIEEKLQVSGTIEAKGEDLQGKLLIPPTTMNFSALVPYPERLSRLGFGYFSA